MRFFGSSSLRMTKGNRVRNDEKDGLETTVSVRIEVISD